MPFRKRRLWVEVRDPDHPLRIADSDAVASLHAWKALLLSTPFVKSLRSPVDLQIVAEADACATESSMGLGGYVCWPSGRSHWFAVSLSALELQASATFSRCRFNLTLQHWSFLRSCCSCGVCIRLCLLAEADFEPFSDVTTLRLRQLHLRVCHPCWRCLVSSRDFWRSKLGLELMLKSSTSPVTRMLLRMSSAGCRRMLCHLWRLRIVSHLLRGGFCTQAYVYCLGHSAVSLQKVMLPSLSFGVEKRPCVLFRVLATFAHASHHVCHDWIKSGMSGVRCNLAMARLPCPWCCYSSMSSAIVRYRDHDPIFAAAISGFGALSSSAEHGGSTRPLLLVPLVRD